MLKGLAILLLGAALGVAGLAIYNLNRGSDSKRSSMNVQVVEPGTSAPLRRAVVALGTIEPADGIVQVGSSLVGYRIQQVLVQDGQTVKEGDLVVELDASSAQAELELAQAQLDDALQRQQAEIAKAQQGLASAELAVKQAAEGKRLELATMMQRIELANLKAEQAKKDVEHTTKLRGLVEPLATQQQVEHQKIALEAALAEKQAATVAREQLEQSLAFREQTANAELNSARQALELAQRGAGIESLRQSVRLAELRLSHTKVTAPSSGTVLQVFAHPGEIVAQQPLLQLADLDTLVCVAEVEAADVPHLEVGQPAVIRGRAFPNTELNGKLDRVGASVGTAALRPLDPRQPVDRTVAKAVVLLDAGQAAQLINTGAGDRRAALVGLQVEVEFPIAPAKP